MKDNNMYQVAISFSYYKNSNIDIQKLLQLINLFTNNELKSIDIFYTKGKVDLNNGDILTFDYGNDNFGFRIYADTTVEIQKIIDLCRELSLNSDFTQSGFGSYRAKSDLKLNPTTQKLKKDKLLEYNARGGGFGIVTLLPEENEDMKFFRSRKVEGFGDSVMDKIKDHVYFYHKKENGSVIIQLTETYDPINFDENYYNTYKKVYEIIKENMDS
jgi:hypothetical protein